MSTEDTRQHSREPRPSGALRPLDQSTKLQNVLYEIRGPVNAEAERMEADGQRILKLNTGNPAAFGFDAPDTIVQDMIAALPYAQGYSQSKGIPSARRAVVSRYEVVPGFPTFDVEDVFIGNGVSELITMTTQALLNDGDEVLIPAPDYPLWTAATTLSGGKPVHYLCDEEDDWAPSIEDIESKITERTKAIVIINPNNPTGAVYSREIVQKIVNIAREHSLLLLSDEIYDKILYDDAVHIPTASLAPDLLCITFNGLSKAYRVAGYRAGWAVITGPKSHAKGFIEGLTLLASTRLCANVPAQYGIQVALSGTSVHRRPGAARWSSAGAAQRGLREAQRDSRCQLRQADGCALRLPAARPERARDPRRRAVHVRPAALGEDPDGAGYRHELAGAGPLPRRHPAVGP